MRLSFYHTIGQVSAYIGSIGIICALILLAFTSCNGKKDDVKVVPPVTSPLSGNYIGFGVIVTSYTHVSREPEENSTSIGYLRRGSVVPIIERRIITRNTGRTSVAQSWVLIEEPKGWLKEEVMDIYNNESRAITAAQMMSR